MRYDLGKVKTLADKQGDLSDLPLKHCQDSPIMINKEPA